MTTPIIKIKGIGPQTAVILAEHGFTCAEDLASSTTDALGKVQGFGPSRAKTVIEAARALCKTGSGLTEEILFDDDINAELSSIMTMIESKDESRSKKKKKTEKKTKKNKKVKKTTSSKKKKKKKKKKK